MDQTRKPIRTDSQKPRPQNEEPEAPKMEIAQTEDGGKISMANSPKWGATTKLVVALTVVAIVAALLIRFQFILSPLLIALTMAYLLHPIAAFIQRRLRISWSAAVSVIYLLIVVILLGLLTLGGVGLVQQVQNVVKLVQDGLREIPALIEKISGQIYQIGPFEIDFSALDLEALSSQALNMVQPLLNRTSSLLGAVVGSAANFLGWTLFVLLVSYFVMIESGGFRDRIIDVKVPGYSKDIERLSRELGRIWNAFLRGQIIIFFLAVIVYTILLGALGVRYAIGLALLAGLARFVPYVGPAVNWIILILVTYFNTNIFGMSETYFTLLILGLALVIDQIFDNFVSPRVLSSALKVHPAAVLVAAIVAANLFGILGVVIAAPILATVMLFWGYIMRKMFDLDPWPEKETRQPPPPGSRFFASIRRLLKKIISRRNHVQQS